MDPADRPRKAARPGAAGVGVVLLDARGTILAWSAGARRLVGHRARDVVHRSARHLLHVPVDGDPSMAAEEARRRVRSLDRQGAWSGTVTLRHRDGRPVVLHAQVAASAPSGTRRWLVLLSPEPGAPPRAAQTGALVDNSPVALAVWDTDLRCLWANRTVGHERGPFRYRRKGLALPQALRGFDIDAVGAVMRQVLADGRPAIDHEFRWVSEDGREERVTSSTVYRLEGEAGEPWGVCTLAVDITRSRARAQLALLSEAGRRVGTTLDVATTAQELADVAVPLLADFVTVDVVESVPLGGEPLGRLARDSPSPMLRRAATSSVRPGVPESVFSLGDPVFLPPGSPLLDVLRTGEPHFAPVLEPRSEVWLTDDPHRAASIRRYAMHSAIVVPLTARNTVLGVSVLVRTSNPAPFTWDDLLLARDVARRAALSLDNARQYTRERASTLALQRDMLPRRVSGRGVMDIASRYVPAGGSGAFGGDWFDVIPLPGGRLGLMVGDVVGRGINAVATMGRLRTAARTLALLDLRPHDLLTRFDQAALALADENRRPDGFSEPIVGATCCYVDYDPATAVATFASAGHMPPALVPPDGEARYLALPQATYIGLGRGGYASLDVVLRPRTVVALFTDGLVDPATSDIDAGLARLRSAFAPAAYDLDDQCARLIDTMTGGVPADDVALLLARATGAPAEDGP